MPSITVPNPMAERRTRLNFLTPIHPKKDKFEVVGLQAQGHGGSLEFLNPDSASPTIAG